MTASPASRRGRSTRLTDTSDWSIRSSGRRTREDHCVFRCRLAIPSLMRAGFWKPVSCCFIPMRAGAGKSLTEDQIQLIIQRLAPQQVVLVGRSETSRPRFGSSVVDLVNRTSLSQLIWIIRRAACVVSVDSGPSHLAAAVGRPLIAIHTWSDPRRVGPYRDDAWVWKNARLVQMKHRPRTGREILSATSDAAK